MLSSRCFLRDGAALISGTLLRAQLSAGRYPYS